MKVLEVDEVGVQYNRRCEFSSDRNRLVAAQIQKKFSLERLGGGSPLLLPTAPARRISDSEAYRTQPMLIGLNVK
jgi:hypothetical protein